MKKVIRFLKKHDIGYGIVTFNAVLFDGKLDVEDPLVEGLRVWFKCGGDDPGSYNNIRLFKRFMDSVHTYDVAQVKGGKDCCVFYVTSKRDRRRLEVYREKVNEQERKCFENIKRHIEALNSGKILVGNANGHGNGNH